MNEITRWIRMVGYYGHSTFSIVTTSSKPFGKRIKYSQLHCKFVKLYDAQETVSMTLSITFTTLVLETNGNHSLQH